MQRLVSLLSTAALLATVASAQCFESNFGVLMPRAAAPTTPGVGDDVLFDLQPLGFSFPMGGVASAYTHAHVGSNGVIFLTTGAVSGATTTGYSAAAATMVNNLRGTAGQPPRLAAYWRDLNMLAANNGGVFFNNTFPGKFVVTWRNAVPFAATTPVFTVQAQIFADGHVEYFYSGTTQNTVITPICGISQGNAVADPGISDLSNPSVGVSTSKIVYQTFGTANTFDLQTTNVSFFPNAGGGYDVIPSACVPAFNQSYGTGCYRTSATFYESFAANTIDLSNSSILLVKTATGYVAAPGSTNYFTHTVPGLALTDDVVATVALPSAFTYPGGTTSSIGVCSNGYIWMQQPNALADFSPTNTELFSNAARLCPAWLDVLPDGAANINNVFAEADTVNNKFYVTWVNCPTFTTPGVVNMQVELDLATGNVEYRYQTMTVPSASIVGWTPGTGVSANDAGSIDLSVNVPLGGVSTSLPELSPLTLAVSPTPVSTASTGTTLTYTTSNMPEFVPTSGLYVGLHILSLGQVPTGLDLGFLGAPGCSAYVLTLDVTTALVGISSSQTATFNLPAGVPAGLQLYSQSAALVTPNSLPNGQNAFGLTTSNGIRSVVNAF